MPARKFYTIMDRQEIARDLQGSLAERSHYTDAFEDDVEVISCEVSEYLPNNIGPEIRRVARLIPGALSDKALELAYDHIKTIKSPIAMRGRVIHKGSMMPRIDKDGNVSDMKEIPPRVREIVGYSDTIGYLGPSQLNPEGRLTSYTRSHKKARPALTPVLREIDKILFEEYPEEHAWQAEAFVGQGVYNWYDQLGDETAFSSCYANVRVRSAYHPDAANLGGSLSALFTMGEYEGGGLVIPRYGVCFRLQPGDLLFFRGDDIHGVLPFKGERLSGVFFSAAQWTDFWEEVELPKPLEEHEAVKQLIAYAKERGYLLFDEVNRALPAEIKTSEQFDELLAIFERNGIGIYEDDSPADL